MSADVLEENSRQLDQCWQFVVGNVEQATLACLQTLVGLLTVNRLTDLFTRIDPKSAGPINRRLSSYRPVELS